VPKRFALLLTPLLFLLATACSGGQKFPDTLTLGGDDAVTAPILSSELVVGPNRFVFGVLGQDGNPIIDAKVHLTFYELNSGQAVKRFETDAVSRVPERDAGLAEQEIINLPDGTRRIVVNAPDSVGVYTAEVNFDNAGDWGVELAIDSSKPKLLTTLRPRFNVIPQGQVPNIGAAAPRSHNATTADTPDLSKLDSSAQPSPDLLEMTIADAVASGKPTLVLFAAPGFCISRFCGPELEIMRKLAPDFAGKANFIHVEFYTNEGTPQQTPVDTAREWNLQSEPWFFVIDSKGNIAARFEGATSLQELQDAMRKVTAGA
jgi:hypothetical protein